MIERTVYLDKLREWKDRKVVKVISGMRRCGKSTLLAMFREYLLKYGVDKSQIQSINFEDIDNERYKDYHVLYSHIKSNLVESKMNYVFLDEIQEVGEFQRAVDSLALMDNVDIYITGSNSHLLSGEIATLLSGRYVKIEMLPLSFSEYVSAVAPDVLPDTDGTLGRLYRNYQEYGSLPYILELHNDRTLVDDYLEGIYNTILLKDIVRRCSISDVSMLESVIRFLADNIGRLTAYKPISDTMTSAGRKISSVTVENYIKALTDSYIFYVASRYDIKGKQFLKTGSKYYLADVGLRNVIIGTRTGDLGFILENIVFLELKRRWQEVYVGKTGSEEIDFVTMKGDEKNYYQVALTVRDKNTLARELNPLEAVSDHYPKTLLTLDDDPVIMHNGIRQIYVLDWLLNK